jgi:hypothetical protein
VFGVCGWWRLSIGEQKVSSLAGRKFRGGNQIKILIFRSALQRSYFVPLFQLLLDPVTKVPYYIGWGGKPIGFCHSPYMVREILNTSGYIFWPGRNWGMGWRSHCPVWHKPHQLDLYTCSQRGMVHEGFLILWETRLRQRSAHLPYTRGQQAEWHTLEGAG